MVRIRLLNTKQSLAKGSHTAGAYGRFLSGKVAVSWTSTVFNWSFGGVFKGVIFTSIVALVALFFTRKRIFWKT